jgi:hypothetical protein
MNRPVLKTISLCFHLICGLLMVAPSFHHASAKQTTPKHFTSLPDTEASLTDEEIREEMKKYLGVRYKRAGASRKGFDCSGFVKVVYREIFGVNLPHQSSQQSLSSSFESASLDALRTGDLVFFSTTRKKRAINHVGVYLSDGKFIHAARSRGVVISNLDDPYWRSKIIVAKRLAGRIPVESTKSALDLAMSLGPESAVVFHYEKREIPAFSASAFENDLNPLYTHDRFHNLELGYAQAVHPLLTSRFTIFREYFLSRDEGTWPMDRPMLNNPEPFLMSRSYVQGLRLESRIRPMENLYISPSLSFLDYGSALDGDALPNLALGLTFDLFSSTDGWALSTGLRMPLRRSSISVFDEEMDDFPLSFSLTFRQQLSERVQLSITGDNFLKLAPGSKTTSSHSDTKDQHFGFMLHFFY